MSNPIDALTDISASETWQPIAVAVALTAIQVFILLVCFELARRNPKFASVYDRRRLKYPKRTPPPLRRRWYPTWWNIKVADEAYNSVSRKEDAEIQEKERTKLQQGKNEHDEEILSKAEEYCRKSVPFFRDLDDEEDEEMNLGGVNGGGESATQTTSLGDSTTVGPLKAEMGIDVSQELSIKDSFKSVGDFDDGDVGNSCSSDEEIWDAPSQDFVSKLPPCLKPTPTKKRATDNHKGELPVKELSMPSGTFDLEDSSSSIPATPLTPRPLSKRRRSQSLSAISEKERELEYRRQPEQSLIQNREKQKSLSEHGEPLALSIPLIVGASELRRVRFDEVYATNETVHLRKMANRMDSNITVGSRESQRLAKLRFEEESVQENWDKEAVRKASKFVKQRVLMMRDRNGNEENEPPQASIEEQQKKFISRQVMRRPLSREDQELLRIVGLDAFMILRFLRFATDVFFWPFLLTTVTLIPLYMTADNGIVGFYATTVVALIGGSQGKYWLFVGFGYVHFCYILRRLWIEWELFIPLRHDFLEHGDFEKEKYKEQYRMTCLVEFIPASHRHDKNLFHFFDTLFPSQVKRAEVLLNTEFLRRLIRARLDHIVGYENVFAKMVHERAEFLRNMETYEKYGPAKSCCRGVMKKPSEPKEPKMVVIHRVSRTDMHNVFLNPQTKKVSDPRTWFSREWHYRNIQMLNNAIDDEYIRLAQAQRRPIRKRKEGRLAKWLGIKYITGSDVTHNLHSSTGFVEFTSIEAKQAAVQCNLTGVSDLMKVSPVPEIKDIVWENCHVSRALIQARKAWADIALIGCLIGWSFLVTVIRSYTGFTDWVQWEALKSPAVAAFMEVYLPAFIVEGLVRGIPFILKFVCKWIRFKSASDQDTYILLWYFGFRCVTFIFIIVGGSLVDSGFDLLSDPIGFLERLADNVALESQFFITYVLITGGMSTFFFMCQMHNVAKQWFICKVITEEAVSQRKLDDINASVKQLHKFELLPIALFVFIVGVLYGAIAPLASAFVIGYFRCTYKAFKYMYLFYYGKFYENGGQLFYHLSTIVFFILYLVTLIVIGYLSRYGTGAMAGLFAIVLLIILVTHLKVMHTFVEPSRMLSLAKARMIDDTMDRRNSNQRKLDAYRRAKADLRGLEDSEGQCHGRTEHSLMNSLLEHSALDDDEESPLLSDDESIETFTDSQRKAIADKRMQMRYREHDSVSDFTDEEYDPGNDFFIYRQPSLNRVTWELSPRPYRQRFCKDSDCEIWR